MVDNDNDVREAFAYTPPEDAVKFKMPHGYGRYMEVIREFLYSQVFDQYGRKMNWNPFHYDMKNECVYFEPRWANEKPFKLLEVSLVALYRHSIKKLPVRHLTYTEQEALHIRSMINVILTDKQFKLMESIERL